MLFNGVLREPLCVCTFRASCDDAKSVEHYLLAVQSSVQICMTPLLDLLCDNRLYRADLQNQRHGMLKPNPTRYKTDTKQHPNNQHSERCRMET